MKTQEIIPQAVRSGLSRQSRKLRTFFSIIVFTLMMLGTLPAMAHCDSYDGPVIKDAVKALETNNVELVMKWVEPDMEKEILNLFNKTYSLKNGDKEIYAIVEKHFFETLVRLHRETENAPYTGLKEAGTTKQIIKMSDMAIESKNVDNLLGALDKHINQVIKEKYEKVAALDKVKNESPEQGREFVKAYVDYTHTVEALHDVIEHGGGH